MNKALLALALIVVAVILVVVGGFGGTKTVETTVRNVNDATVTNLNVNTNVNARTQNANTTSAVPATNASNVNETTAATEKSVAVTSSGFTPKTLTMTAGDTVRWMNGAGRTVYVAPDNHPSHTKYAGIWDDDGTGQITSGATYELTFSKAGTYTYHDHLNSVLTGTIIVQ